jgi:EmrB/QacA subfamily drug resistance transporter
MHLKTILCCALAPFMASLDTYVVNISLPAIARNFHVDTSGVSWVVLAYLLALTGTLLIFGRLGDRFGLKRVFLTGFAVFTAASLLCGIAPGIHLLILARFLQGIGAAMLLSMGSALITRSVPAEYQGAAFRFCATAVALGIMLGTPLGGLLTGYASWHWIFLINIPVGAVAIACCQRVLPSDSSAPRSDNTERFDATGAGLIFASLLLLVYALNSGGERGWTSPWILGTAAAGIVLLILFLSWERRTASPLLDLSLFRDRAFTAGNLANCGAAAFLAGNNFLLPFYLEQKLHLQPQQAGLVMLVYSLVYMAASLGTGRLVDRAPPALLGAWAMLLGSAAALGFALTLGAGGLMSVMPYLVALAIGYALFIPSNNHMIMTLAPEGKLGVVSGLYRMEVYLSMVVGVVLLGGVFHRFLPGTPAGTVRPPMLLELGFRNAYCLGAIFCIVSVVFSRVAQALLPIGDGYGPRH